MGACGESSNRAEVPEVGGDHERRHPVAVARVRIGTGREQISDPPSRRRRECHSAAPGLQPVVGVSIGMESSRASAK